MLGRDVVVAELAHLLLGRAQDLNELARPACGLGVGLAGQLRQRIERRAERLADGAGLDSELAQHRHDHPAVLLEQHREQVLGRGLRIAAVIGQPLGGLKRLLGFDGETVWLHSVLVQGSRNLSHGDLDYGRSHKDFGGICRELETNAPRPPTQLRHSRERPRTLDLGLAGSTCGDCCSALTSLLAVGAAPARAPSPPDPMGRDQPVPLHGPERRAWDDRP